MRSIINQLVLRTYLCATRLTHAHWGTVKIRKQYSLLI